MANLIAKTPCEGMLPVTIGALTLSEHLPERITSVMPFDGADKKASGLVKETIGVGLPAIGRATGKEGGRAVWFGQGQSFILGAELPEGLAEHAAVTDQSDAWAVVRLEGAGAEDVLSRLSPLDFRAATFKRGHTARTELQHMMASITRLGANSFEIMVMRGFAKTLVHDLETAMKSVAARTAV